MKLRLASILVAALGAALAAAPATAEDMNLSKIRCKEFISADKDKVGTILTWLEGYYTDEDSPTIIYADKIAKDTKNLTDYCNAHGNDDVITAADTILGAAMAGDMDLSKITCKEFISADKDKVGTILTWLEGYYTEEDSPTIIYADKTAKDTKKLTDYCNAHGNDDVITAAGEVME